MNCQEVQLQLSGYREKSLDAIRMKGIETHLGSCPFCRAEAHGLSDCIGLVADLPLVNPPAGFAQRVMAHAREIELELRPWQRLLAALRSTAPIQATAVLLVGILAVFMYEKEPRLREASIVESTPAPTRAESETPAVAAETATTARATVKGPTPARENAAQTTPSSPAVTPARTPPTANPPAAEPAAVAQSIAEPQPEKLPEVPIARRRPPIRAQEVSTGREFVQPNSDAFNIGAFNQPPFIGVPFAAGRALSPLSEPSADFEFIVRRRGIERREAAERSDELRKRSEADAAIATAAAQRTVPTPAAPSSSIVEIRWFTVQPHHLEHFRKELAAEANIDSEKAGATAEKEVAAKSPRDPLLIKVIILPSER
jgi:hypothetical protein